MADDDVLAGTRLDMFDWNNLPFGIDAHGDYHPFKMDKDGNILIRIVQPGDENAEYASRVILVTDEMMDAEEADRQAWLKANPDEGPAWAAVYAQPNGCLRVRVAPTTDNAKE